MLKNVPAGVPKEVFLYVRAWVCAPAVITVEAVVGVAVCLLMLL